ncbi:hypothetical protein DFH09DRAFT_1099773 [Mycena vulgaris]|nr:hypothetical protein DFH09DRAFT_1099773 [Mycena vulgaris]
MGGGTTPITGGGAVLMRGGGVVDGSARPIAFSEKSENVALDELYNIAYMTWVISETVRPKKAKYSTKRGGEMDSDGVSENAETSSQGYIWGSGREAGSSLQNLKTTVFSGPTRLQFASLPKALKVILPTSKYIDEITTDSNIAERCLQPAVQRKKRNAYMTHVNVPRKLVQQELHVHFISTSPNASVPEQFREFKQAVEETHTNPVEVQDDSGDPTCFCIHVNAGASDNPMQSEISAHIGGKGNCLGRKCRVGGTQKDKATDEGYHALFEVFIFSFHLIEHLQISTGWRTSHKGDIVQELEKQVKLACSSVIKHVKDSQTETGVKDAYTQFYIDELLSRFKEMRKNEPNRLVEDIETELVQWTVDNGDKIYSPFLTMKGFDPAKDTPIELLHSLAWDHGLSINAIRANYIMQYAGSLSGRQFKTLAQTNLFHVRGLVTDDQFKAWRATGELAVLLWQDLRVAVANVPDIFETIDPSKIVFKIKYHLLVHTDEDLVQFGPLVGVITKIFESFNVVFRHCSVLSNHLAPSRDIARQSADQEGLKHRLVRAYLQQRRVL